MPRGKKAFSPRQPEVVVADGGRAAHERTVAEVVVWRSAAASHPHPQDPSNHPLPQISQGCYRKLCLQDV